MQIGRGSAPPDPARGQCPWTPSEGFPKALGLWWGQGAKPLVLASCAVAAVFLTALAAQADDTGSLLIRQPWARASIGLAKAGAAYVSVENRGAAADRLLGVETPVARRASLHTHKVVDGVARMRPAGPLDVAPGAVAVMEPGGLHVMLMGLTAPLMEGERFIMTLTFERAGEVEVVVEVRSPFEAAP